AREPAAHVRAALACAAGSRCRSDGDPRCFYFCLASPACFLSRSTACFWPCCTSAAILPCCPVPGILLGFCSACLGSCWWAPPFSSYPLATRGEVFCSMAALRLMFAAFTRRAAHLLCCCGFSFTSHFRSVSAF